MRVGFIASLLLLASPAAAEHELTLEAALFGGFDSHLYLESIPLESTAPGHEGALIGVSPDLRLRLGRAGSHHLRLGYAADLRQYFQRADGKETILKHGVTAAYISHPLAGFRLWATATFDHMYSRQAPTGWIGGSGSVRIDRALGSALRGSLGYSAGVTCYDRDGDTTWEVAHRALLTASWRIVRGVALEPGYMFAVIQSSDSDDVWVEHLPGVGLTWSLPWAPVQFATRYGLDLYAPPSEDLLLLNEISAEVRVSATTWLEIFVRLDSSIGPAEYTRHLVQGGLAFELYGGTAHAAPRRKRLGAIHVELEAPKALEVAVIGTFNDWDPKRDPLQNHGGTWRGSFRLSAGSHRYMLWVDGEIVPPPGCLSWASDGFGGKNCVVTEQ